MASTPSTSAQKSADPLLIPQGEYAGRSPLKIQKSVVTVGGDPHCHLKLNSSSVSRHHALIIRDRDGVYIRDLASRTKVVVNGQPHRETLLADEDELHIGKFSFKYASGRRPVIATDGAAPLHVVLDGKTLLEQMTGRTLLIGKGEGCDISLTDESVSSRHAIIFTAKGRRYLRDLDSRTGTFLKGVKIHQEEIRPGDEIRVGKSVIKLADIAGAPKGATVVEARETPEVEAEPLEIPSILEHEAVGSPVAESMERISHAIPLEPDVEQVAEAPVRERPLTPEPIAEKPAAAPVAETPVIETPAIEAVRPIEETQPVEEAIPLEMEPASLEEPAVERIDLDVEEALGLKQERVVKSEAPAVEPEPEIEPTPIEPVAVEPAAAPIVIEPVAAEPAAESVDLDLDIDEALGLKPESVAPVEARATEPEPAPVEPVAAAPIAMEPIAAPEPAAEPINLNLDVDEALGLKEESAAPIEARAAEPEQAAEPEPAPAASPFASEPVGSTEPEPLDLDIDIDEALGLKQEPAAKAEIPRAEPEPVQAHEPESVAEDHEIDLSFESISMDIEAPKPPTLEVASEAQISPE